ncbi:M14 family metallopeptidase [Nitrospina watsonii]|uniref:Succinylglutamate desuccinylase/aspartoacylase n=1 Tax=Nitrospina watsonii TaxID=1323948 RepID=A0ABN8VZT5_9BACT|nr:M14 family metallopeptidase [Nitrospina watsonii]CAI2717476.1 Putative Succinylglutamate desuccinylase/aspartoacylase [Nitrospina watsonii]
MKTETIVSIKNALGGRLEIVRQTFPAHNGKPTKRISFVAGLHGDELAGLYLCHLITRALRELQDTQPEVFLGEVNIYPAANPAGIHSANRLWPFYGLDMNRVIGQESGHSVGSRAASQLYRDIIKRSEYAVDIHASNLHFLELPQIRVIEEFAIDLLPLASETNADLIWVHPMAGLFESTLGYNLNQEKIPTLVVETGICHRIHPPLIEPLYRGMMHYLRHLGILDANYLSPETVRPPRVLYPKQVVQATANHSGLFISRVQAGETVHAGQVLGQIVDAVEGEVLEDVAAPAAGLLFTLREHPLTHAGALLARIAWDSES